MVGKAVWRGYEAHHCPLIRLSGRLFSEGDTRQGGVPLISHDHGREKAMENWALQ